MRREDIQGQMEPVFNPYKNRLKDIIDSNIDDGVSRKSNLLKSSKPSALI